VTFFTANRAAQKLTWARLGHLAMGVLDRH
jgi:hypothetical protein